MCICGGSVEWKLEEARSNAIYRACIQEGKKEWEKEKLCVERGEYADEFYMLSDQIICK